MNETDKASILLVDDRPENLLALEGLLEVFDINIVKANSGSEALSLMLENEFALVLLDVQMPDMNGFETAELMRGSEATKYIPIIFVTAISKEKQHVFKGYDTGAVDYLFKPLEPEIMRSKVNVFINLYRQKMALKNTAVELKKTMEELEKTNKQLQQKIKERNRAEERLQHAQKMETIGTLAGAVAHDLNNVLGSIVGYPDLLLDDIPEDSPMRSPVLAIKQSGERAAAIVQDLLTLARRGVIVTEAANLNSVIARHLESREHVKMKEFHPAVEIETNLEADLLNIMGSPVQLSKVVMNLLSNAAEAMPDGGKLLISTANKYLDKPINGYDMVKEGDYVVLSISDNGIGIAKKDLAKIFEPFYTKKVMGRSGTGLGMAVVWGTVKDHKGYIDVESTEGVGTTLSLYFPVTRKEIETDEKPVSIERYNGKGEKILVVDDVEAQRDIAVNLLKKLNYNVKTVAGGEEAVEYMKNQSADLLVLDMIMEPGIDGLDTFKKILEIHPNQKAIIASGFSETDRIKEVQKIGAGAYIKKPYTLEKIGFAVKSELQKQS